MKMIIKGNPKRLHRLKKELKLRLRNDKLTCEIVIEEVDIVIDTGKESNIPSFEEFKKHALDKCKKANKAYNEFKLKHKYDVWVNNGWKDEDNKKIKNWKSKLTNTIKSMFKDKK